MPISSQNNLGEVTNANYMGVTSCYQCHIGGNKCQGVESGAGFGPYMKNCMAQILSLSETSPISTLS